jgi:hypothetical protein
MRIGWLENSEIFLLGGAGKIEPDVFKVVRLRDR